MQQKTEDFDEILQIAIRKAIMNTSKSTTEQKKEAAEWLKARGFSPSMLPKN